MNKQSLCGLSPEEILGIIGSTGYSYSHAVTIAHSVYKKGIDTFSQISKLPGRLKRELEIVACPGTFRPVAFEKSADSSIKYLFRNEDGLQYETVLLPDQRRNTVCVSTQSGCKIGCRFCATGRYGYHGNLSAGEIINQIISLPGSGNVTHVVFMGMGEPLDNIENVLKACKIITAEWGLAVSTRNVTVSTVGLTPGVSKFLKDSDCNLTLSLHSPFSEERKTIIPVENRYPANEIIDLMKRFSLKKKRRVSVAYVMIKGINDTQRHLAGLKELLLGTAIRINLLPYHRAADDDNESSSVETMEQFKHELVTSGISASIRKSRGVDISAACGLLASGLKQFNLSAGTDTHQDSHQMF